MFQLQLLMLQLQIMRLTPLFLSKLSQIIYVNKREN